jgi:hypothetical protein
MKKTIDLLLLIAASLLSACGGGSEGSESGGDGSYELFNDPKFENGFNVRPADRSFSDGSTPDNRWPLNSRLYYGGNEDASYAWTIQQAGDIYGLGDVYNQTTDAVPEETEDGTYIFSDTSKSVQVNPTKGTFRYELNTSLEYEEPRVAMGAWCHLLLEEGLAKRVQLSEIESLSLSIDVTLDKIENHMSDSEYNPSLHTCQFLIYFVCNTNASLDSGSYLWFGVPIYDYRYTVIEEYGNTDAGGAGATNQFIYSMSTESYLPDGMTVGTQYNISIDMKPAMSRGLEVAQSKGYLTNSTVDDLSIEYMNIGYEIPGTFDSAMTIGGLSLLATPKAS